LEFSNGLARDYLVFEGNTDKNIVLPFRKRYLKMYKNDSEDPQRKLLSVEKMSKLVNSILDPRDKAIAVVLAKTGVRRGELLKMDVSRVTVDDMIYIDMQFGNHQNMHRDYKIYASKWDITKVTFTLNTPNNDQVDLKNNVIDIGMAEVKSLAGGTVTYTDKNGYLVTSFQATQKGIYIVDVRQDTVVSYAPERSIKCAKAIVGAIESSMKSNTRLTGFDKPLDQVLEIIPLKDPTALAVGDSLPFMVLFKGLPLADAEVSVIPRGETLPPMGTPNQYDFMTDMDGMVEYIFTEANYHLIVVHMDTDESGIMDGKSYSSTKYTGDLTVIVSPAQLKTKDQSIDTSNSRNGAIIEGIIPFVQRIDSGAGLAALTVLTFVGVAVTRFKKRQ